MPRQVYDATGMTVKTVKVKTSGVMTAPETVQAAGRMMVTHRIPNQALRARMTVANPILAPTTAANPDQHPARRVSPDHPAATRPGRQTVVNRVVIPLTAVGLQAGRPAASLALQVLRARVRPGPPGWVQAQALRARARPAVANLVAEKNSRLWCTTAPSCTISVHRACQVMPPTGLPVSSDPSSCANLATF